MDEKPAVAGQFMFSFKNKNRHTCTVDEQPAVAGQFQENIICWEIYKNNRHTCTVDESRVCLGFCLGFSLGFVGEHVYVYCG
jgi:hypothetical protein